MLAPPRRSLIVMAGARAVVAGFDPSSLALEIWNHESYAGVPWAGTASAGSSGSHSLIAGVAPGAGTVLGGYTSARFNGTNTYLEGPLGSQSFSTSAGFMACLFIPASITGTGGISGFYNNPPLVEKGNSGPIGLALSTFGIQFGCYNGSNYGGVTGGLPTVGQWALAMARWDNTTLEIRLNSDAWTTTARTIVLLDSAMVVGGDPAFGTYFDGDIREVMTAAFRPSDLQCDQIKSYLNALYGLSL